MENAKFTKGPWKSGVLVDDDGVKMSPQAIGEYVIELIKHGRSDWFSLVVGEKSDGKRYDICHVGNGGDSLHNAHLIAASPELYKALQLLIDYSPQNPYEMEEEEEKLWLMADKALKKARGEQ